MLNVAVVGGTGYTGAELLRILHAHPNVRVSLVAGQSRAGQPVAAALPSLRGIYDGDVEEFSPDRTAEAADVAFCALPHGASAGIVSSLRDRNLPVFDLSADFRLRDRETYRRWYGEHLGEARFGQATYGLPELYRDALRAADLVAVPGCYPTATLLALAPLIRASLIETKGIVVDAKSGVSGAGRGLSQSTHFPECAEGLRAYKIGRNHRHIPEIEQELEALQGSPVRISFTPHLVPMNRGMLVTAYATMRGSVSAAQCVDAARRLYEGSPSVVVLDGDVSPDTLWTRGSNRAFVSYALDEECGRIIAFSAIDNLVKGASGQAVQCMNVRFGFAEGAGLEMAACWP